jgi:hypothetical protein
MPDAQLGRLAAQLLLTCSRDQADALRRGVLQEFAVLSSVWRIERGDFTQDEVGVQAIAEKRVGLRASGSIDHPMASALKHHPDHGTSFGILNCNQDKQK